MTGFVTTIAGIVVLLVMVKGHPGAWYFAPGLFLIGVGVGVMLTPSVNVVQSAFPENLQGEISGLSRSVSNLGSSFGTAIAGTILVAGLADPKRSYAIAMIVLAFLGLIGLGATILWPAAEPRPAADIPAPSGRTPSVSEPQLGQPIKVPNGGCFSPVSHARYADVDLFVSSQSDCVSRCLPCP